MNRRNLRLRARASLFALLTVALSNTALASPALAQPRTPIGLSAHGAQRFNEDGQDHRGPAADNEFGFAVAAGDFNGDGADDLAVGVPLDDFGNLFANNGSVVVRWGVPGLGLGPTTTVLDQLHPKSADAAASQDLFGWALATGDFDGDQIDDLAVGIPNNLDPGGPVSNFRPGGLQLFRGRSSGGIDPGGVLYVPESNGTPGHPHNTARFGEAVAFGDFNGDGRDDLAIGAPKDHCWPVDCGTFLGTGSVTVLERDAAGNLAGFEMILGDQGLPDVAEAGERFGSALATGDFNHDGFDDLAIGVPFEDNIGAVLVVYGSPWSLLFAEHEYFSQWDLNATVQGGSRFGEALAAGDFDGDGFDDLAVGIPFFDGEPNLTDMGLAVVVYGSTAGVIGSGRHTWLYEHQLYGGGAQSHEYFGASLAAGDFNADGLDDLAIGAPGEHDALGIRGEVSVIPGRPVVGLAGPARRVRPGNFPAGMIPDEGTGSPYWGSAVTSGDFDGNGFDDLAIAAKGWDLVVPNLTLQNAGAVAVVYGQLFVDGFEAGDAGEWSSVTP